MRLDREYLLARFADHVGLHDIEFESEDFNRQINVKRTTASFANDLIDARMMQWLVVVDGAFRFEVSGTWALCFSKPRGLMELVPLLGTAKQFLEHVPRVVFELYGVGASR